MKPIQTLLSVALLALSVAALAGDASSTDSIVLDGKKGDTVDISVAVKDAENIGAFEFEVTFDPDVIEVSEVGLADFLGSTGRRVLPIGPITRQPGQVTFGASTLGSQDEHGPNGYGVLAAVTVKFKKTGSSPLRIARYQTTDPQGNLKNFKLSLETDVAVTKIREPRAERFVLTLPGEGAESTKNAVVRSVKLLMAKIGKDRDGDLPKAVPIGRRNADSGEIESDGTLVLVDTPENLEKAAEILSTHCNGETLRQSLWVVKNSIAEDYPQVLKDAGLPEDLRSRLAESVKAGKHVVLGYRLCAASEDQKSEDSPVPALTGVEIKRIQEEARTLQAFVVGLPSSGTLLIITPLQNSRALERDVLHTLSAGTPDKWEILAFGENRVFLRDGDGYLHSLQKGPDPSGFNITQIDADSDLVTAVDRESGKEYEIGKASWKPYSSKTDGE